MRGLLALLRDIEALSSVADRLGRGRPSWVVPAVACVCVAYMFRPVITATFDQVRFGANAAPQVEGAWSVYTTAYDSIDSGAIDFGGHTFKVMLVSASYSPDVDVDLELSDASSNRVGTDQTVTVTRGTTEDLDSIRITSTASWDSPGSFRYAVLYDDDQANDQMVAIVDYGAANVVTGGVTFRLQPGVVFRRDVAYSAGLLFEMDLTSGAYPLAGFQSIRDTVVNMHSVARVASGGPGGGAYYRFTMSDTAYTCCSGTGQPYVGWGLDLTQSPYNTDFGASDSVFVRFRFRFMEGTRCESLNNTSQTTQHVSKFHMIADQAANDNGDGRIMLQLECEGDSGNPDPTVDSVRIGMMRANGNQRCYNTGDIGNASSYTHATDSGWMDVQYRVVFSSTPTANDASTALWVDNNTYGSPDCLATTSTLLAGGYPSNDAQMIVNYTTSEGVNEPEVFQWGFFWNAVPDTAQGGVMGYEMADYEIGLTFDATWSN